MRTSIALCISLASSVIAGVIGAALVSTWKQPSPQQSDSPLDIVMLNDISKRLKVIEQDIAELSAHSASHANTRLLSSVPLPSLEDGDGGAVILGDPRAEFIVLEFSDYYCAFCKRYNDKDFSGVLQAVESLNGAYIALDFPLSRSEGSAGSADLSYCAHRLGDYLTFRNAAFGRPDQIRSRAWEKIVAQTSIDAKEFDACLNSQHGDGALSAELAKRLGVRGTPTFFVARRDGAGAVNGVLIEGRMTQSDLEMAMREL